MTSKTLQRFKASNGLAYHKTGSGPPIVLVHGVGLRAESWVQQIPTLSNTHTVYAVDMPGHGESQLLADSQAGLTDYVDAIADWIVSEIKTPVIIIGHSMGSMIAINFASRYTNWCLGLVALNSVYRRTNQAKLAVAQRAKDILDNPNSLKADAPIKRWFKQDSDAEEQALARLCRQWLMDAPRQGYARAYNIFSLNDGPENSTLENIQVPALFITGDGDTNSSGPMSQKMAALCRRGSYAVIEDSRHMAQMTHASEINQLLVEFVNQCPLIVRNPNENN